MRQVAPWAAFALLAGVAGGVCGDLGARIWLVFLTSGWLVAMAAFLARRPATFACAVLVGCLGAGGTLGERDASAALEPLILQQASSDDPVRLEGRLRDDAELTEFGAAFTIDVTRVWLDGRAAPSSGGVRLSVGGALATGQHQRWRAGRLVRVTATLRRPQAYRNFGVPDQETRTALRGVRLFGSVKSATLVEVIARAPLPREAAAEARARIRRIVDEIVGSSDREAAAIVVAVLIGDRAGLSADVESRLQRAGTFHVIAISGGNIAILVGLALWILRRLGLPPRAQALTALTVIAIYAGVVSGGSSVARATLGASLYLVARALDHRAAARTVIAVTAGVLLLASPLLVLDIGCWLTFVASLAILEQAAAVSARCLRVCRVSGDTVSARAIRAVSLLLSATVVAEGSLVAISAYAFGQVTAAGLALNFLAVPLMSVVQMAGFAVVACASVHPLLARAPAMVAVLAARGITESARAVNLVPWAAPHVVPPPLWLTAIVVATWWGAWWLPNRAARRGSGAIWLAGVVAIVAGLPASTHMESRWPLRQRPCSVPSLPADGPLTDRWLRVTFIDVAQGSAALVRFPDQETMMVDAGGAATAGRFDVGRRVVSPALWALGVRRLSVAVLTHGDLDHIGGARAILDEFRPRGVWEGVPVPSSEPLRALTAQAASLGLAWKQVHKGNEQHHANVTVRVWHPPLPDWERPRVRNDDSIVIELRMADVSIVLPGDIGSAVEADLARQLAPSRLRVIEAAHHGSRWSTSTTWLEALAPRAVIVSAGRDNRFGHPSPTVLERVRARGVPLFRTDRDGAIALDTNGRRIWLTTCGGARFEID